MAKETERELKRGTLEMVLLRLLNERPMYGYELVATLAARGGETFQLKEGTLYPVLYRLENDGHIESRWEAPERGVPRKYYHLTAAGEQALAARLVEWQAFVGAVARLLGKDTLDEHPGA
jgi:PadR family transcriptional regulator PadR